MTLRSVLLAALSFAALGAAVAQPVDLPLRKAGLWELVMKMESPPGMPAMTMHHCTDEATDKALATMFSGPQQQICGEQKVQNDGSTITIDSVCTVGGAKTTSRAVFAGDFNSAYTVTVNSKREGGSKSAMMAPGGGDSAMTIAAKWAGPCKAGQKPGDIVMPGGIRMNIADMQKMRDMMAPGK